MRRTISSVAGIGPPPIPTRGGLWSTTRTSVTFSASCLPARMKKGTPDQRQFMMSSRRATKVSVRGFRVDALDLAVALVLAPYVAVRVRARDRLEEVELRVADRIEVGPGGWGLHGHQGERLQEVVLDDVPEAADRVVEAAAVLDAEVLRHRDLHGLDVAAVPDRLEQGVREAQVGDVLDRLLAEEVVDPVDLLLRQDLVDLVVELDGRVQVVPEGLLDHDPGVLRQPRAAEPLDHSGEERGGDLQIEDGVPGVGERLLQLPVGLEVVVVPLHVAERVGESLEDVLVERPHLRCLEPGLDRLAGVLAEIVVTPLAAADADHGHLERPVLAQVIERLQGHLLREIARDPEDHQGVALRTRPRRT